MVERGRAIANGQCVLIMPSGPSKASSGFAAFFSRLKCHFPPAKIFYDLRLDLRFVCYNGCELNDMY